VGFDTARERFPGAFVVVAVGKSGLRRTLADRVAAAGFEDLTLVHPGIGVDPTVRIGRGVVVCAGSVLTVDLSIADGVQINIGCTISHDVSIGAFATLAPGVHLSGAVSVGEEAQIGTGAVVRNGTLARPLRIGRGAVVGAGACVVDDVPEGETVVGVPARPIARRA